MPTLKLRQTNIDHLRHGGRDNRPGMYWDEELKDVGLRVYPNGCRIYVCAHRDRDRKRLVCLGRPELLTLAQARRLAMDYFDAVARGDRLKYEARSLRDRTIDEMYQAYVAYCTGAKSLAYGKRVASCLRSHVLPRLAGPRVTSIDRAEIDNLHDKINRRHPCAAVEAMQTMCRMLKWGKAAGLVPVEHANPAAATSWLDRWE